MDSTRTKSVVESDQIGRGFFQFLRGQGPSVFRDVRPQFPLRDKHLNTAEVQQSRPPANPAISIETQRDLVLLRREEFFPRKSNTLIPADALSADA